jgi:glycosyltransferase involved in cell wall biosynthesis
MPRVSVIIATYNWSSVLPYSIGSVLRQTFTDFELLVVGDGCTDDSEQVVTSIGDPRVRWINLPANTGHQSSPNNEGIRQARGEVIAYLGHDDLWLPHHLEVLVGAMDREGSDAAFGILALIGPSGHVWPTMPRPERGELAPPSGMIHRRRLAEELGGWPDYRTVTVTPEAALFRRAHAAGHRFTFVRRLTALKFPASARRNVYQIRPSHEQAAWSRRIMEEPDLEQQLLVRLIVEDRVPTGLTYRELARHFWQQTVSRIRRRLFPAWGGATSVNEAKRFKGVKGEEPR